MFLVVSRVCCDQQNALFKYKNLKLRYTMSINTIYIHGNRELRNQIANELAQYFGPEVRITRNGNDFTVELGTPATLNDLHEMHHEMWDLAPLDRERVEGRSVHWSLPANTPDIMEVLEDEAASMHPELPARQLGGNGGSTEHQILSEQLEKYEHFIHRGKKNPRYELAQHELEELRKKMVHGDLSDVIQRFIDLFSMLEEHGFPIGNSHYPGPGKEFKNLVEQYQ